MGHTHEQVPDEWKDSARGDVCDATTGDAFVKPLDNKGSCPQYWIATTTQTGEQKCVLTVPSLGSSCPTGFALEGGLCAYQPQDSADWQVGFCRSFKSYEVPPEWVTRHVCDIDPVPNSETTFVVQPSSKGSCQQNWVSTMSQTGQQECILTVPSFKNMCPIGFALNSGLCKYVPQNGAHWQVGFCHAFTADEIPPEWTIYH
ncbi:MAG TPA: hypothetical protein VHV10_15810, partial [Ktedonobacteraceae bacterium]|nr:hypothetical protein [Ktedonobacteraceae bacterium]